MQIIVVFFLVVLTWSVIDLEQSEKYENISAQLQDDPYVAVYITSVKAEEEGFKVYYTISTKHRQKREAYNNMKKLFKNIITFLKQAKLIHDQTGLVHSRVKPQYLTRKRKWSLTTIFVVLGTNQELQSCSAKLGKLGARRLQTIPSINFLNEKMVALRFFSAAKLKLNRFLAIRTKAMYSIHGVQDIEIKGEIANSDVLEEQLEDEFNESQEDIQEEDLIQPVRNRRGLDLSMRVVFRVGKGVPEDITEESHSDREENSSSESESSEESL